MNSPAKESFAFNTSSQYNLIKSLFEEYTLQNNGIVVRLSNVYGPGMSKANVISDILNQLLSNGPVIVNSLNPIRDYIFIDDVIKALNKLSIGKTKGVYNIGSGKGTSVRQLITLCLRLIGSEKKIFERNKTSYSYNVLDISKAKKILKWEPRVSLLEGLSKMIFKND